jgi:hydrogenase nickel incorporation protein HypB
MTGQVDHHAHEHPGEGRTVVLEEQILARNNHLAEHNREWLRARGISAVNLMSSPGAGKTTLLARSLHDLAAAYPLAVIEGDQETTIDADRVRAAGAPVLQVNTGAGCHLDAAVIGAALPRLDPPAGAMVFIENVGNLICPVLFDLGEGQKVVLTSVTEGADKPLKYPQMFQAATLVLLTKIDLLAHVEFSVEAFTRNVERVNRHADTIHLSATRGDGLHDWYHWLDRAAPAATPAQPRRVKRRQILLNKNATSEHR